MGMNCLYLIIISIISIEIFALEFPFIHHYETQFDSETENVRSRLNQSSNDTSNIIIFYMIVQEKYVLDALDRLHLYIDPCRNRTEPEHKLYQDVCDSKRTTPPFSYLCTEEPDFRTGKNKKFTIVWTSVDSEVEHYCRHTCTDEKGQSSVFLKSVDCEQTAFPEEACRFPKCWEANGQFIFGHHYTVYDSAQISAQAMHIEGEETKEDSSIHTPFIQQSYQNCSIDIRYRISGPDAELRLKLLSLNNKVSHLRVLKTTDAVLHRVSLVVGRIINPSKLVLSCIGSGNYTCTVYQARFDGCDDFSHEVPCNQYTNPFQCVARNHYTCSTDIQCNGMENCEDGKDEHNCPKELVEGRLCSLNKDEFCPHWNVTNDENEAHRLVPSRNGTILLGGNFTLTSSITTETLDSDGESYLLLTSDDNNILRDARLVSPLFPPTVADRDVVKGMSSCSIRLNVCFALVNIQISILVPGMKSKKYKRIDYFKEKKICEWKDISIGLSRQPLPFQIQIGTAGRPKGKIPGAVFAVRHVSLNPACFSNSSTYSSYSYKLLSTCNKTGAVPPTDYQCSQFAENRKENPTIVNKDGSQTWTAPRDSKYIFRLCGASGGYDPKSEEVDVQVQGYCMYLKVNASLGDKFIILVGQQGEYFTNAGGGGGASLVLSNDTLLAVAAGGGGFYTLSPTYKPYESASGASVSTKDKRDISSPTEEDMSNNTTSTDPPIPDNEPVNQFHLKFSNFYKPRGCFQHVSAPRKGGFGGGGFYCGAGGGGGAGYVGGPSGNKTSGTNGSSYVDESFGPRDSKFDGYNLGDGFVEILFCNLTCPLPTVCEFDIYEHNYQYCACPNGQSYLDNVERDCKDIIPPWISDKTLATIIITPCVIAFLIAMTVLWWHSNFFGDEFKTSIRRRFKDDPAGRKFSSVRFSTVAQRLQAKPLEEVIALLKEDPRKLRRIPADNLLEYIRPIPYYCIQMGETIGAGHFGTVHKGETVINEHGRMDVACKYVECEENNQSHLSIKRQVIMEGVLMSCAALLSNTTIKAYGMAFHEKSVVLVMEYMNAGDLANYLRMQCRPKYSETMYYENPEDLVLTDMIQFMLDIASGCSALETLRCVHRDLAARNCLLNINEDNSKTVKIGDFGLVKEAELVEYGQGQTRSALPVKWLPLEAIEECNYSNKTDVWSFGIVCWEILTRAKTPYGKRDCKEVGNLIKHGKRLKLPEGTLRELEDLIYRCWYSDPERRPDFSVIVVELKTILINNATANIPNYSRMDNTEQQLSSPDYHGLDDDWCFHISVGTPSTIATELTTPRSPMDLAFVLDKRQDFEQFVTPRTPEIGTEMQPLPPKSPRKNENTSTSKDLGRPANVVQMYNEMVNDTYMQPDQKVKKITEMMASLPQDPIERPNISVERPTTLHSQEKLFPRNMQLVKKKIINESYEVPENKRATPSSSATTPLQLSSTPMERPTSLSKQILFDPREKLPSPIAKYEELKINFQEVPVEIRQSPD